MIHFKKSILATFAAAALFAACSGDGLTGVDELPTGTTHAVSSVTMTLTRAAADSFAQAGISNVRVFAYIRHNKVDSLVKDTTVNIGGGQFQIGLPLGENIRTFIVANAQGISNSDKLDSVTLSLDPTRDADIWLSNVASLTTDKTVSSANFTMRRVISRATFRPEENAATLASLGRFDNIDVTFTNIATQYRVNGDSAVALTNAIFNATAANGYSATANTFPTRSGIDATAGLALSFKSGNNTVNSTPAAIDGEFNYAASHHYVITVPLTDNAFIETPWTRAFGNSAFPFHLYATPIR